MKSVTKKFYYRGNKNLGTRKVTISPAKNGEYLVYASTFEEDYGVLRTSDKTLAIKHANILIAQIECKGYELKT